MVTKTQERMKFEEEIKNKYCECQIEGHAYETDDGSMICTICQKEILL